MWTEFQRSGIFAEVVQRRTLSTFLETFVSACWWFCFPELPRPPVPADEFEQSCNMWTESSDAFTFSAEDLTRLQEGIGQQLADRLRQASTPCQPVRTAQDADQLQSEPEGLAEPYPPTGRPCSSNVKWKSMFHAAKWRQHEDVPALPHNTFLVDTTRLLIWSSGGKKYCSPLLEGRVEYPATTLRI